jgi:hypothetical protein
MARRGTQVTMLKELCARRLPKVAQAQNVREWSVRGRVVNIDTCVTHVYAIPNGFIGIQSIMVVYRRIVGGKRRRPEQGRSGRVAALSEAYAVYALEQ